MIKAKSIVASRENLVKSVHVILAGISQSKANITPLTLLGSVNDDSCHLMVRFDGEHYSDEYYKCNCPSGKYWYDDSVKDDDSYVHVNLETLLLHCFKGEGYKDEYHSFLPTDGKKIDFLSSYAAKMIENGLDMVR